jgi:hypothetical protein
VVKMQTTTEAAWPGGAKRRLGAAREPDMMRYGLLVCPAACLVSAALLWMGSRRMRVGNINQK